MQSFCHLQVKESPARWMWVCSINVHTHTVIKMGRNKHFLDWIRQAGIRGPVGKRLGLTSLKRVSKKELNWVSECAKELT